MSNQPSFERLFLKIRTGAFDSELAFSLSEADDRFSARAAVAEHFVMRPLKAGERPLSVDEFGGNSFHEIFTGAVQVQ